MDIDYLLFLQEFRNNIHDTLTPFMEGVSFFCISFLSLIPIFVYWCIDKRKGLFIFFCTLLGSVVNSVVKLTACVYRPWIRDARILPAGNAITTATGYSFPSGHTVTATTIYGPLALQTWKRYRWLAIIFLAAILVTAFSRNYLGVHTPQDVVVGLLLSVLTIWLVYKLFGYVEKHPEKEDLLLLIGFLFGWLVLGYITVKSYPMDYVDGRLLVDPQRMMDDAFANVGMFQALVVGRYIDKHWLKFQSTGLNWRGILCAVVGMVPLVFMINSLMPALDAVMGPHWGHYTASAFMTFYSITLFPLVIKLVFRKQ